MKRFFVLFTALLCVLLLVGCNDGGTGGTDKLNPYFTGKVIEKYEKSCLLEVTDIGNHNFTVGDEVVVNTDIEDCPNYKKGDLLTISFNGVVAESYPMQIHTVYIISLVENK